MTVAALPPDRRRYARAAAKGTAILRSADYAQRGRIMNLGRGGSFVLTPIGPPARLLMRAVDLEMRLDSAETEWVRCAGRVVRLQADGLAIHFTSPPVAFATMLDDLDRAQALRGGPSVVLIDPEPDHRAVTAASMRADGCTVLEASTPLEAIVRLGEASFEPDVIAIAASYPDHDTQAMRTFAHHAHPAARIVHLDQA